MKTYIAAALIFVILNFAHESQSYGQNASVSFPNGCSYSEVGASLSESCSIPTQGNAASSTGFSGGSSTASFSGNSSTSTAASSQNVGSGTSSVGTNTGVSSSVQTNPCSGSDFAGLDQGGLTCTGSSHGSLGSQSTSQSGISTQSNSAATNGAALSNLCLTNPIECP